MQFTVPVHVAINKTQQVLSIHCELIETLWTCQSIKHPDAIGVNTDLQAAIKEVVNNVKKNTALVEN